MPRIVAIAICAFVFLSPNSEANDASAIFGQVLGTIIQHSKREQPREPVRQPASAEQPKRSQASSSVRSSSSSSNRRSTPSSPLKAAFNSKPAGLKRQIQTYLQLSGYYNSTIDALWGGNTKSAIELYAASTGNSKLLTSLNGANAILAEILSDYNSTHSGGASAIPSIAAASAAAATVAVATATASYQDKDHLKGQYNEIHEQTELLKTILQYQQAQPKTTIRTEKIGALQTQIDQYDGQIVELSKQYQSRYSTPIRPANANLGMTSAKASEIFPKVPYYIPGTEEIGEMLIVPTVTDSGELKYDFEFLDPEAEFGTVRESMLLSPADIELAIEGFDKVSEWSDKAQEEGIRRRFDKVARCFPLENCEEKKTGISSTEIVFLIYEDGSTAAQVQRNKGTFSSGYNLSIESSLLLSSYLEYMGDIGQKEFNVGSMTEGDLDNLFE